MINYLSCIPKLKLSGGSGDPEKGCWTFLFERETSTNEKKLEIDVRYDGIFINDEQYISEYGSYNIYYCPKNDKCQLIKIESIIGSVVNF